MFRNFVSTLLWIEEQNEWELSCLWAQCIDWKALTGNEALLNCLENTILTEVIFWGAPNPLISLVLSRFFNYYNFLNFLQSNILLFFPEENISSCLAVHRFSYTQETQVDLEMKYLAFKTWLYFPIHFSLLSSILLSVF